MAKIGIYLITGVLYSRGFMRKLRKLKMFLLRYTVEHGNLLQVSLDIAVCLC